MRLVVTSQYYRARDPHRQREIDACLAQNLHHPGISKLVLFLDADAPPPPTGPVACETVLLPRRLTYADWLARVGEEPDTIALLLNADIHLAEGLEHLPAVFDRPDTFLALTRYNPGPGDTESSLNDYPHWTQDCWGVRADAPIPASLLHASAFPLGFPGCDNRIASVMWSHGFTLKNPSYHVRSVHRHADTSRGYDKSDDRLYGGVAYVHPSLSPAEPSELEHAFWTRASDPTGGLVINGQAVGAGLRTLLDPDPERVEPFHNQQRFTGLSWSRGALGSAHLRNPPVAGTWPSEDTIFLPLRELEEDWRSIGLRQASPIAEVCVRLPRRSPAGMTLELVSVDADGTATPLLPQERAPLAGGGARTFLPLLAADGRRHHELRLRLKAHGGERPSWDSGDGLELVLFGEEGKATAKSLRRIAEAEEERQTPAAADTEEPSLRWCQRQKFAPGALEPMARFGRRFHVLRAVAGDAEEEPTGGRIVFDDPFWPGLWSCPATALPADADDPLSLFLWGFGQPRLELRPERIGAGPRHRDDALHWWPGSGTEADAWQAHGWLRGPQRQDGRLHMYLGLPWATFLETGRVPEALLQAHRSRLEAIAAVLAAFDLALEVHSVCQHPRWRERPGLFEAAGVTTLWLSHRPRGVESLGDLRLRSWHLCPFGHQPPAERPRLRLRPPQTRPFLASFQGDVAGLDAETAAELACLHHEHRWHVEIGADWPEESSREGEAWDRYDRILGDSVFSLCPPGVGANRERIWDSLAVGTIPVLLGNDLALPEGIDAEEIGLVHPTDQLESLPARLAAVPAEEVRRRSDRALEVHRRRQRAVCFGSIERPAPPPRLEPAGEDPARPTVVVPLHGRRDRWFWRLQKCAFYDIVLEWYQRGRINLRFSEGSYFWWGREGEVLLFERDLIINLRDGKKNPPRWSGDVPYRHAFFANQYPLPSARHHTLTYWGYAPVLLERLRQQGRRGWQERDIGSLFAGTVENETQEYFRNRFHDWGEVIEVHACADRLNRNEPSPFPLREYLDRVGRSRFGVSFHGNGPKCYREIEYLALGTPMILTEGIETNYPEPLQEGLHFRLARTREELRRIVGDTGPEEWERMSRACWEWFERNGTIDRLFDTLASTIAGLHLEAPRHRQVRIRAGRLAGAGCRAARSLALVDPEARILFDEDPGACPLRLKPDDLVTAELPLVGREAAFSWRVSAAELRAYCASIRDSAHPTHRALLTLVGVRLPNFRIRIEGPQGVIDPFDRLVDGAVVLRGPEETAMLRADYDWTRRCTMKYPELVRTIAGPARLEQARVSAVLRYQSAAGVHHADLSPHFTDWHVVHGRLIEAENLHQALKLWEYEGCRLLTIRGRLVEGGQALDFEYRLR
jgi:hypothetical protein